jgi:hypothetical protein
MKYFILLKSGPGVYGTSVVLLGSVRGAVHVWS